MLTLQINIHTYQLALRRENRMSLYQNVDDAVANVFIFGGELFPVVGGQIALDHQIMVADFDRPSSEVAEKVKKDLKLFHDTYVVPAAVLPG